MSLNNMGTVLGKLGELSKALDCFEESLAMYRKLYPPARFKDGHADLARGLNNLGVLREKLGQPAKALDYKEQALAMCRKLYPPGRFPDGHAQLAVSMHNMGHLLQSLGQPAKALDYHEQALAMNRKLSRRETGNASEAQALAYRNALHQLTFQYGYLSAATQVPPTAALYAPLWATRGGLLPALQARHQVVLARRATSPDARKHYDDLITVRQKISRLQATFAKDERTLQARDKELANLNDEQDRLERQLAENLPEYRRLQEMARKGPADLARALPKGSAFFDFIRYAHWRKGKAAERRYAAFVVAPGKEPSFLQLGDAASIDEVVAAWRNHIAAGEDSLAPAKLRELVWDKVARELPARTKVVYLCLDGGLAQLPFAALPGTRQGTVLLEDHALAVVPSGPWLLDQLLNPPPPGTTPGRVLAIGDVDYGRPGGPQPYQALEKTGLELKRVLEAFGQGPGDGLTGTAATTAAVRQRLDQARYAHFATHGYFDEKSLAAERKRLQDYLDKWTLQADNPLAGGGVRNPVGYIGLVLAGANDPENAGPDGGILTGLSVVDLPLEGLRLCVLSACETGLGELTEGEGVLGLQRAFHAAGCPDVIGSLWKVDDEATAALMTQFYYELRVIKRTLLEALREAQLTVYRHPERIAELAKGIPRGKINPGDTVTLGSKPLETKPGERAKTTPTKLWAAFVLSGAGTAQ
jgi:CHAT domain-containing protein/tetratricopeptide (TPR) repeat protein